MSEPKDQIWDQYSQSSQPVETFPPVCNSGSICKQQEFSGPRNLGHADSSVGFLLGRLCMAWTWPGIGSPGFPFRLCFHPFHPWLVPRACCPAILDLALCSSHGSTFPPGILSLQQKGRPHHLFVCISASKETTQLSLIWNCLLTLILKGIFGHRILGR